MQPKFSRIHSLLRTAVCAPALVLSLVAVTGASAGETILWTGANGSGDVAQPAGLIMDSSGNFYGTGMGGGAFGGGGIFELVPNGGSYTETVIYSFCAQSGCTDGQTPLDRLIMDTSGDLYGVTYQGGKYNGGSVFELIPNSKHTSWKLATLYSFCRKTNCTDGYRPQWALSYQGAQGGQLYDGISPLFGTTNQGGRGNGVAFELTYIAGQIHRSERVIHKFCSKANCTDGAYPQGLIVNSKGVVFGATNGGGAHAGDGVVFKMTFNSVKNRWHEKVLYNFGTVSGDGCCQTGDLSMDSKGNLYGMSSNGGAHSVGTVWEVSPKGSETILYNLCSQQNCADGSNANAGVSLDSNGNIFGETPNGGPNNCGALFEISGGTYSLLYDFCAVAGDLFEPSGGVVLDSSGNLYGTAIGGGTYNKGGVYAFSSGAR